MWLRAVYLLLVLSLSYPLGASAPIGAVDSVGREFVLAFQSNHDGESPYLGLFIASRGGATGTVEIPGLDFRQSISIAANELIRVELPREARDLPDNRISERAVQLSLDGDATVYAINRTRHTTDAFLALPVDALGTRYRIMAYRAAVGSSQVAVAATADGTEVHIWPSAPVSGAPADEPLLVRLDRGQIYSLVGTNPSADLTGTSIESSAPVAVMAGAECANVPPEATACDHLVQMMPPLSTWGKRFVTLPIATRNKGDLIRILADSDGTLVRIDGTDVARLDAGEILDKILVDGALIEADRPILDGQFSLGTS